MRNLFVKLVYKRTNRMSAYTVRYLLLSDCLKLRHLYRLYVFYLSSARAFSFIIIISHLVWWCIDLLLLFPTATDVRIRSRLDMPKKTVPNIYALESSISTFIVGYVYSLILYSFWVSTLRVPHRYLSQLAVRRRSYFFASKIHNARQSDLSSTTCLCYCIGICFQRPNEIYILNVKWLG